MEYTQQVMQMIGPDQKPLWISFIMMNLPETGLHLFHNSVAVIIFIALINTISLRIIMCIFSL